MDATKNRIMMFYEKFPLIGKEHPAWDYSYDKLSEFDKGVLISLILKKIVFRPSAYNKFLKTLNKKERVHGFFTSFFSAVKRKEAADNYKKLADKGSSRSKFRYKILLDYLSQEKIKNKKVLDAGCGTFPCFDKISKKNKAYGIDFSERMVRHANKIWRTDKVIKGDAEKIPFPEGYFDAAACFGVLIFYKNIEKIMLELARVSKKAVIFDIFDSGELPYVSPCWLSSLKCYYLGRLHEPYQHDIGEAINFMKKQGFTLKNASTFTDGISNSHKVLVFQKDDFK